MNKLHFWVIFEVLYAKYTTYLENISARYLYFWDTNFKLLKTITPQASILFVTTRMEVFPYWHYPKIAIAISTILHDSKRIRHIYTTHNIAALLPSYCLIFPKSKWHFVSRTHILQSGLTPLGSLIEYVTRFSEWMWHLERKQERSYFHTVINA